MHAITLDYDRNMARMEKVVCVCGGGTSSFEFFENGGQEREKKREQNKMHVMYMSGILQTAAVALSLLQQTSRDSSILVALQALPISIKGN